MGVIPSVPQIPTKTSGDVYGTPGHVTLFGLEAFHPLTPLTTNLSADSVSEGNGESEDDEGKKESNQDFHSEISVSVYGAWRNLTGGGAQGTFVLDFCLAGQASSP